MQAMLVVTAVLVTTFPIGAIAMRANNFGVFMDSGLFHHAVKFVCPGETNLNFNAPWHEACDSFDPGVQSVLAGLDSSLRLFGLVTTPFLCDYIFLGGLLNIYHFSSSSMLFCVAMYRCLKLSTFDGAHVSVTRKYELYVFYRAQQIMHDFLTKDASPFILMSIALAAGILITSLVALISFSSQLHPMLIIIAAGAAIMTLLITKILFKMANIITDTALEFRESFLRNDRSLTPVERRRLKACKPLEIWAGSLFIVSRHTYITFVNDVVADNVINFVIDLNSS